MAGFVRRFGSFPGIETLSQIEGVNIVDLPPPGSITGEATGVVAMVGEFPDMKYATAVDSSGVVTTKAQPVEVFSAQDMLDKVGGFDETLGDVGNNGGNAFVSLRNKSFSRLVLGPVNLCAAGAGRVWRDLPTNLSATQPIPTVPLQGGSVAAGREFRNGANRVRLGMKHAFTALGAYASGVDGAGTSAGAAATQTFNSAGSHFLTAKSGGPVKKGDLVVIGVLGAAGAQGANAATYRVQTDAVSDTALVVEKLDGTNFDWTTGTNFAFRIHPQTDGDSGGLYGQQTKLSDPNGYDLPCRPLDATIAAATKCTPTVVPTAGTATSWDPLSGLTMQSFVTSGFVYDANVMAPNAANHASIDALYASALTGMTQDAAPARDVNVIISSRLSSTIRTSLKAHALAVSAVGKGRMTILAPNLQTTTTSAAIGSSDPGVGANRDERVIYTWPGEQTFVQEAVGYAMGVADGTTTTDGRLDVANCARLASILSNLAPERNPGEATTTTKTAMASVLGFQRGVQALSLGDYIALKANGICGMRQDRKDGFIFQSGVTTSLTAGQKNIARRRMADFIEDSVADVLEPFSKLPLTQQVKDGELGEVDAFLNGLLSPNNSSAQRIVGYTLDDKSGNTPDLEANGVHVIIGRVRTLASQDAIVFQAEVGEGVVLVSSP